MDTIVTHPDEPAPTLGDVPRALVVPLDGSSTAERALPVARALATRLDARLVLVASRWGVDEPDIVDDLRRRAAERPDIATETRFVVNRSPADAITSVAAEIDGAMVCMSTHGRGRVRWAVASSHAEEVLRRATGPVMLVGRHCAPMWPRSLDHLMLCVDGSSAADATVPVAIAWAKRLALDVTVAEAVHPLDVETIEHGDPALSAMARLVESRGVAAHEALLRGSSFIPGSLADHAADLPAALIVMSSHTRHGVARAALGSVAMGTVALAPCPVLIVPRVLSTR